MLPVAAGTQGNADASANNNFYVSALVLFSRALYRVAEGAQCCKQRIAITKPASI